MERGGRDREKKQREEKEKEKKRKLYILVKRKEKTERRRNGIGAGLPHFIVLHCDLVAGEQNPVSVGSGGGRRAAGPVHAQGLQWVTMMFLHRCLHSPSTEPDSVALYRFGNLVKFGVQDFADLIFHTSFDLHWWWWWLSAMRERVRFGRF